MTRIGYALAIEAQRREAHANSLVRGDRLHVLFSRRGDEPKQLRRLQGGRMTATGQLFHALNGHHRTPVLLDVYRAEAG